MRAASYAIGAMKALNEFDQLDSLDVISGVSGGTYAMMWYYAGVYGRDSLSEPGTAEANAFLFSDANLDKFLSKHSKWHYRRRTTYDLTISIAAAVRNLLNAPFYLLDKYLEARLGDPLWTSQETLGALYRERLVDLYVNYDGASRHTPTLSELENLVTKRHLPWPVLNFTVYDDQPAIMFDRKRIFEVTPFKVGSHEAGYAVVKDSVAISGHTQFDKTLSDYVRASGAAFDVPLESIRHNSWRAELGLGLGMKIYAPVNGNGESMKILYLADGGFSENLGTYGLVRRGCRVINVVDAEYDPWFKFEGYSVLERHIREGMGMHLAVKEIEMRLKKNVLKNPVVCPDGSDECIPAMSSWPLPLMEGSIPVVRIADGHPPEHGENLVVRYLKLSVKRDGARKHFESVPMNKQCATGNSKGDPEAYFTQSLVDRINAGDKDLEFDPQFPQISTWDQSLSEKRVRALLDLGYAHMKAMICRDDAVPGWFYRAETVKSLGSLLDLAPSRPDENDQAP